jgi:hypothetical protein
LREDLRRGAGSHVVGNYLRIIRGFRLRRLTTNNLLNINDSARGLTPHGHLDGGVAVFPVSIRGFRRARGLRGLARTRLFRFPLNGLNGGHVRPFNVGGLLRLIVENTCGDEQRQRRGDADGGRAGEERPPGEMICVRFFGGGEARAQAKVEVRWSVNGFQASHQLFKRLPLIMEGAARGADGKMRPRLIIQAFMRLQFFNLKLTCLTAHGPSNSHYK